MDPESATRRSGRARHGREVFSPEWSGGTGSTRWSPGLMRRSLSGNEGSASVSAIGGSRSLEKEKRSSRDRPRETGKEKEGDGPPPVPSRPINLASRPSARPASSPRPPSVQASTMQPSAAERSPSIELIDATPLKPASPPL